MTVHIIAEDIDRYRTVALLIQPYYEPSFARLESPELRIDMETVIVAVDLRSTKNIEKMRRSEAIVRRAKKRIFVLDAVSRLHAVQACSLGATKVLFRPTALDLARELAGEPDLLPGSPEGSRAAAAAGAAVLKDMFTSVNDGVPINVGAIERAGAKISEVIAEEGLSKWLDVVRGHHESTYQHCLLVTGVTVGFALHLGLHQKDISRLSSAAMLHDVGKAAIPLSILDKPGKLDDVERAAIETHPLIGHNVLNGVAGVSSEMLDSVRHHHEFLDGSGYPDRLCSESIGDLVRILTISDIFAALIEWRAYRPPMARETAYDILCSMRGKLEQPLVAAFQRVALVC